ncbi:nucleotidyltransferase [Thalictrum thalictroides]|uniref:Nucleotidyltransferase n=1 Tax=Thalictrum thalictroides TaxID=46969 RepID=A0A7J6VL25_THATH|nr:nucleotidyltransferase [Thalictrum thalictroides]
MLVLYIFYVVNNSFAGPLEVLCLLELFSIFDWENFGVSLWGPVPVWPFPDVTDGTTKGCNGNNRTL